MSVTAVGIERAMIRDVPDVDGDALRHRREHLGWTQEELAHRARRHVRTVQNAEGGHIGTASLERILTALDEGETAAEREAEPELTTVHHTIDGPSGPIRIVITARTEVIPKLDFAALVAHALESDARN
jgi:transcriptional regulator with XRE-family HTH domain